MTPLEEKLLKEIDALKIALEKAKRAAQENAQYKAFIEQRVNQKTKDSVFINLFSNPEYQMLLYKELFPEDKTIKPEDLELFRVERILTNHPYIGLLARRKLIVLAEAQTKWSVNIIKGGIIINFCRVYDAQRDFHKNDMEPQKGIAETVDICIEKGYLRQYLMEHRAEVEKIMYNPEYVKEREQLSRLYEEDIAVLRDVAVPDEKIKELLVRRHGITPTYAQNLLDDKPSTSTVVAL